MKKLAIALVTFFTVTITTYAQNYTQIETPEGIGKYAFSILKKVDHISDKEFINSFITIEEIKAYVNKMPDSTSSRIKEQMDEMSLASYEKKVLDELEELRISAKQKAIDLTTIEYIDFSFKKRVRDGITGIRGKLVFQYKEKKFTIKVASFLIDNKYVPLIIRRLDEYIDN